MNYIVFDLEWNQCPTGKGKEDTRLPFEIVEIGAVKLNNDRHPVSEFHQYIAPQVYHELHYITAGILHIKMKDLMREGIPFSKAAKDFLTWCGEDGEYRFCTWGSMDLMELQRNCKYFGVEGKFPHPFIYCDLQKMFSICYDDGDSRLSLEDATEQMQLAMENPFHSAMNDAVYTAQIMEHMDFDKVAEYTSVDTYRIPAKRSEEFTIHYPTYSKFVSQGYQDREQMIRDTYLLSSICPICGINAHKKIRWFAANQKTCYCVAYCKEHGAIKGKMKIKKAENDRYYVVKIMKPTDEDGVAEIRNRQLAGREKRRERRHREKERHALLRQTKKPNKQKNENDEE